MKENLSAVRLLHFLSVAFLVATCVRSSNPIFRWSGAIFVSRTGRWAILSEALNIIIVVYHPSVIEKLVLDGPPMNRQTHQFQPFRLMLHINVNGDFTTLSFASLSPPDFANKPS